MNTTHSDYEPQAVVVAGLLYVGAVIEHNSDLYEVTAIKRGRYTDLFVQNLYLVHNPLQCMTVREQMKFVVYTKIQ